MKILVTQCFQKASTSYKLLLEKSMLTILSIILMTVIAHAQNINVSGRLVNDAGEAIPDASVTVKGKSTGVKSNRDGVFEIAVLPNATLIISSVGFASREVRVNSSGNLSTITLLRATGNLDQVVVIGYGTQRKKDVTGSTISVKGETLNEIKAPNILNQLQGRAAGVDIVNNSTQLGAGGEIRIRGNRSITGNNNPLIVVDGMAYGGSVNDINPDNISNMDILKDASATAIYGSRGANGVIIITTKRGLTQKAITSYNGYAGVVKAMDTYRIFNGTEYAKFKADAAVGNSNVANANNYALRPVEVTNLAAGVSTDWQNLLLTTGVRTSHDLNIRGGNDKTQYSFGGGYYSETGIINDQSLKRYSFNVNIDHKVSERIKVGFTSFNTLIRSNRLGTNAYGSSTRLGPLFKPYNADGTINFKPASQQGVDDQQINPLTSIGNNNLIKAFSRRYQFQHNFYGEVKILKDLKFKTPFGYGWSQTINNNYTGPNTVFNTNTTTAGSTLSQQNS